MALEDQQPKRPRRRVSGTDAAYGDGRDPSRDAYPDTTYLTYLIRQGRFEFSRRDQRDWLREVTYWSEQEIPHPAHIDIEPVHTGVAAETIQRLLGIFGDRPTVLVGETDVNDLKIKTAQKVQDFANALFPALEHDSRKDTWDLVMEDVLRMGRGYDKLEYVPARRSSAAPGFPKSVDGSLKGEAAVEDAKRFNREKKAFDVFSRLPLMWRHLPARGCYAWLDDEGIAEFMNIEERRIRDVAHRYNLPSLLRQMEGVGMSSVSHVIFAEYWNRSYHALWVSQGYANQTYDERTWEGTTLLNRVLNAQVAKVEPNIYGVVPVIETPGLISTNKNPARQYLSCLDFMIPIVTYLDQLVSQKASAVRMWAWPTPYLKNLGVNGTVLAQTPMGPDGRPVPIEIEPGKMLTLLPGEDIGWVVVPANGVGADELIAYIEKRADALGLSSAVFDASALQSNGFLYNSVLNAIRSKYSQIPTHVKRAHEDRVNLALRIVELHGEPLYVRKPGDGEKDVGSWFALSPSDVQGHHYAMTVIYEDKLPTDDAAKMALAVQAVTPVGDAGPLYDHNTARSEILGIEDPTRIANKILVQEYQATTGKQFLMMKAAQHAGTLLDQEELMQPEQVEMAGLPPGLQQALGGGGGGGAPGNGGSPPALGAAMAGGQGKLGAPTSMGGVPGAPAAVVLPGLNGRPLTPPPPSGMGAKPGPKPKAARLHGGRAAGQSRRPPTQPPARPKP